MYNFVEAPEMGVPMLFFEYFCGQIISDVCPTKKEQVWFDECCHCQKG